MAARNRKPSQTDPQYQAPAYHRPFPPREPWAGSTDYGRRISREIREKLKSFAKKRLDKSWAQKIIARHASGEEFPIYVLDCAREVAVIAEREPGSDDE